jgi:hypothetical protein
MSNIDRYYTKHWAKQGMDVIHIDIVRKMAGKPIINNIMHIQDVVYKIIEKEGKKLRRIQGVRCYWYDENNNYKDNLFFSRDLVPLEIARLGVGEVDKWLKRNNE